MGRRSQVFCNQAGVRNPVPGSPFQLSVDAMTDADAKHSEILQIDTLRGDPELAAGTVLRVGVR